MINVCIVTHSEPGYSETFIRAHLDRLDGRIYHLYGYYLDYTENGVSLRDKYKRNTTIRNRLFHILPFYFVFRRKQKEKLKLTDFELTKRYLLEKNIEVVLAEYGTTGSFIAPVCKALNIPLIVHFHGFDSSRYETIETFSDQYKFMFEYARFIIGVSGRMMNDLRAMGCPEEKLVHNPYGPNPDFEKVLPDYHSANVIGIGRHTAQKAPYLTILAFQKALIRCPELHLFMIGEGEFMEISENMVKSLKLQNNISLLGKRQPREIMEILNSCFLFVQHSLVARDGSSEGTPVAILEAMLAGLPIISTLHAGIPDVVKQGENGFLVEEGDIDGMADYIIKLASDRKLAENMGKFNKTYLKENFSLDQHISTINRLIVEALA